MSFEKALITPCICWWAHRDLNSELSAYETDLLTRLKYTPLNLDYSPDIMISSSPFQVKDRILLKA
jgi:hypothetical protein